MRRRPPKVDPAHEPPARLRAYDEVDWLPLVDPDGYDPEEHRNRMNHQPVGPARLTFEAWRSQQAWNLFSRARLDWCGRYGWPGGLDLVEVLQQTVRLRRSLMNTSDERLRRTPR